MEGDNQRNLLLAIALSVAILVGFNFFFETPQPPAPAEGQQSAQVDTRPSAAGGTAGTAATSQSLDAATAGGNGAAPAQSREQALQAVPRVMVDTPTLAGSISLVGAKLDDLVLKQYRETVDDQSPNIVLLNPAGTADAYFTEFGWASTGGEVAVPGPDTRWQADGRTLTPSTPVTLTWENDAGLVFEQVYEVDDNYLFTVTQRVRNSSGQELELAPFGLVSRSGTPETSGFYLLHEGMVGVLDDTLKEVGYEDARDEGSVSYQSTGGWLGITDKYWMATLVPDQQRAVTARFVHNGAGGRDKYQADFLYETSTVADGGTLESTSRVFAGAKRAPLLDSYEARFGIEKFDKAVDFGWFYPLTKPIFLALHWLYGVVGNFGIAILILTCGIKLLFFPLANKSYKSMAKMRKLQPEIVKLRERFADDKQRLNQEVMALYKREGANPISGCLPVIVQIPVFFSLYKVLFVTIEMRHAPFFGWIQDLSAPDPTTVLNLFGLLPWDRPELGALNVLNLGVWPLIMGLTMFVQQRLNPQPADPVQAKIFMFMPIMFTFLLAHFPAGLVIYWSWNNTLSIAQQAFIMKRLGVPFGGKQDLLPTRAGTRAPSKGGGKPAKEAASLPAPEPDDAAANDAPANDASAPAPAAKSGGAAKPRAKKGGARSRSRGKAR